MDPLLLGTFGVLMLCFIGLSWFAGTDAPYVATSMRRIKKVLLMSGLKKNGTFYELGSGDGRVVLAAALLGAKSYGVEQSWIRVWYSRFKAWKLKLINTNFYHGDIWQREYFPADVVYIYLLQPAIDRLEKKLQLELKKGATVITQTYHFKNWKPQKKEGKFWIYRQA